MTFQIVKLFTLLIFYLSYWQCIDPSRNFISIVHSKFSKFLRYFCQSTCPNPIKLRRNTVCYDSKHRSIVWAVHVDSIGGTSGSCDTFGDIRASRLRETTVRDDIFQRNRLTALVIRETRGFGHENFLFLASFYLTSVYCRPASFL